MTATEHRAVLAMLAAAYPNAKIPRETILAYERALGDVPVALLDRACQRLVASAKWLPTIAEIRGAVRDLAREEGTGTPDPLEAWEWVLDHARSSGRNVGYDPNRSRFAAAERAANAVGGFALMGGSDEAELKWFEKRFLAAYAGLYESACTRELESFEVLTTTTPGLLTGPGDGKKARAFEALTGAVTEASDVS